MAQSVRTRAWPWWLLLAIVVLKAVALWIDPQVRLFLGDSASYLHAASVDDWLPPDRSITYPMLIAQLAGASRPLHALVLWQTAAGVFVAWMLGVLLAFRLGVPVRIAFAAACLFALDPAQLIYERMVMAETFGFACFVAFLAAASSYLARPRWPWLPLVAALGVAAVSFRMNFLPVVLVISVALPLLPLAAAESPRRWRVVAHAGIALIAVWFCHGQFRSWVGEQFDGKPGYIANAGFMRMGLVAPLIRPEHFTRVGLPPDYAARLDHDLADPGTRPMQLWSPGGLADTLRKDGVDVNTICRKLSAYAMRDDPLGVVLLGFRTLRGYFNPASSAVRLQKDLGRDPMPYPDRVISSVREKWNEDLAGVAEKWTPASRWFAVGSNWLVFCLFALAPLSLLDAWLHRRDPRRLQHVLVALFGLGLVATHVLFSNIASYRYLQPLPFFVLATAIPACLALRRPAFARRR